MPCAVPRNKCGQAEIREPQCRRPGCIGIPACRLSYTRTTQSWSSLPSLRSCPPRLLTECKQVTSMARTRKISSSSSPRSQLAPNSAYPFPDPFLCRCFSSVVACCSDCYRVERTSSRAGLTPAVDQRLFKAHRVSRLGTGTDDQDLFPDPLAVNQCLAAYTFRKSRIA